MLKSRASCFYYLYYHFFIMKLFSHKPVLFSNKPVLFSTLLCLSLSATTQAQVKMNIDATQRAAMISNYQYGLFFEEINHAGDGGL